MDRQDPTAPWPKFLSKGLQQPGGWKEQLSSYPQPCPLNICQCLLKTLYNKHPKALTFFCPLSKETNLDIPKTRNITWSSRATPTPGYRRRRNRLFSFSFPSDTPRSCLDCIVGLKHTNGKNSVTTKINPTRREDGQGF